VAAVDGLQVLNVAVQELKPVRAAKQAQVNNQCLQIGDALQASQALSARGLAPA
jgi:hypothetical protein